MQGRHQDSKQKDIYVRRVWIACNTYQSELWFETHIQIQNATAMFMVSFLYNWFDSVGYILIPKHLPRILVRIQVLPIVWKAG